MVGVSRKEEQLLLAQTVVPYRLGDVSSVTLLYSQGAHLATGAALYSASVPIIGTFSYKCCFIFFFGANYWYV
jgi:hypothetical protein